MGEFLTAAGMALWFGVLTSISPCPLATNIAAVSFLGRRLASPGQVLLSGVLYALGRTVTYVALAAILVAGLLSMPAVSDFLQRSMNRLLGPILIVVGMFLLELLRFDLPGLRLSERMQQRVGGYGAWGAGLLGILFALSFCPLSAAWFFGGLIPLAVKAESPFFLPSLFGIGTALPVVGFGVLIALGARSVGVVYGRLTNVEAWARRVTGVLFIGIGVYLSLVHIFGVL